MIVSIPFALFFYSEYFMTAAYKKIFGAGSESESEKRDFVT